MRLHYVVLVAATTLLANCDAVQMPMNADQTGLSKIASPNSLDQPINPVQNIGAARFLRGGKTVKDDESDDLDGEERGGPIDASRFSTFFEYWAKYGYTADDVYKDLGIGHLIAKYAMKNPTKLSEKDPYQKWIGYKAHLEQLKNAD